MATQKVKPDPRSMERPARPRQRRHRYRKVGMYALVTVVLGVVAAAAFALRSSTRTPDPVPADQPASNDPTAPTEATEKGALFGLPLRATGVRAPGLWHGQPQRVVEVAGFRGLPPKGAQPSTPVRGELIRKDVGIHPWSATYLYADGRLIWARQRSVTSMKHVSPIERRLTPKGVDLLRSAPRLTALASLPASAWEDPRSRPYVASRYAVDASLDERGLNHAHVVHLLRTTPIQDALDRYLLSGADRVLGPVELTTRDASALAEILEDSGFERTSGGHLSVSVVAYTGTVTVGIDINKHSEELAIEFHPLLPDGRAFVPIRG